MNRYRGNCAFAPFASRIKTTPVSVPTEFLSGIKLGPRVDQIASGFRDLTRDHDPRAPGWPFHTDVQAPHTRTQAEDREAGDGRATDGGVEQQGLDGAVDGVAGGPTAVIFLKLFDFNSCVAIPTTQLQQKAERLKHRAFL